MNYDYLSMIVFSVLQKNRDEALDAVSYSVILHFKIFYLVMCGCGIFAAISEGFYQSSILLGYM